MIDVKRKFCLTLWCSGSHVDTMTTHTKPFRVQLSVTSVESSPPIGRDTEWQNVIVDPDLNGIGRVMADSSVQSVVVAFEGGMMYCYRAVVDDLTVLS
jgi:hypothetical protein